MYVFTYIQIYVLPTYIHICTNTYSYVHTCMSTESYVYLYTYLNVYHSHSICTYKHIHMYKMCFYIHTYTHAHVHLHMYMNTYIHMYIQMYECVDVCIMYLCTHIYTCLPTYIYVCINSITDICIHMLHRGVFWDNKVSCLCSGHLFFNDRVSY